MAESKASARVHSAGEVVSPWWTVPPPGQDAGVSFEEIWRRYSHEILAGRSRVDLDTGIPIYSLICRLPTSPSTEAISALSRHRGRWEPHHLYPPETVHTTLLLLSPYLGIGAATSQDLCHRRIADACAPIAEVLSTTAPLRVRARGLNVFSSTVFLQLLQQAPTAPAAVRHDLADRLKVAFPQGSAERYEDYLPWDLLFANLMRFRLAGEPAIVSAVECERETDFGEVELRTVELVRTDRLLSPERTEVISRFELGG